MPKEIIIDGENIINATDWKAKSEHIIARLDEELFDKIYDDDLYDYKYNKDGDLMSKTKRNLKRGEVKPAISPAQVTAKLNRFMRIYRPLTIEQAMSLEDTDYLEAYGYYLDIISHINEFLVFLPDKQGFSSFCNINVNTYNELLVHPRYTQIFSSIEDGFVQSNFAVAEAGLVDSKTTIAKLHTKDAGHSLRNTDESIIYNVTNKINTANIDAMYEKFLGVSQKPKQLKNGDKK